MKMIRVSLTALLVLAVAAAVPAFAQHDHDKDGDDKHDNGHHYGQQKHDHDRDGDDRHDNGHHYGQQKHDDRYEHDTHYVRYEKPEHQRVRIPEDHFRAHFGQEHRFRIVRPVVVAGHSRFQYDGYWFAFARPLPPGWRYSDEVYVDYLNDSYFLYSPAHPGIRVSVNLVL